MEHLVVNCSLTLLTSDTQNQICFTYSLAAPQLVFPVNIILFFSWNHDIKVFVMGLHLHFFLYSVRWTWTLVLSLACTPFFCSPSALVVIATHPMEYRLQCLPQSLIASFVNTVAEPMCFLRFRFSFGSGSSFRFWLRFQIILPFLL